jgi:hypothetical protein
MVPSRSLGGTSCCGSGSSGGPRPSGAAYVAGTGPRARRTPPDSKRWIAASRSILLGAVRTASSRSVAAGGDPQDALAVNAVAERGVRVGQVHRSRRDSG